jgi:hypothetical protein
MERSSRCTFPGLSKILLSSALDLFFDVREVPGHQEEAVDQRAARLAEAAAHEEMPLEVLQNRDPTKAIPPLHGALLKNEQDVMLFERLAFMARRKG